MPRFVRLAPEQLEARDTPSLPQLEPLGGVIPIPVAPDAPGAVAPAPPLAPEPAPTGFWWRVAVEWTSEPLLAEHSVYKLPLLWPLLPR